MMRMTLSPIFKRLSILATLSALGLSGQTALADSPCKGLEQNICTGKAQCHWVDSYTRKDGVKVSGHCRSSGTHKTSMSQASKTKDAPRQTSKNKETASQTSKTKDTATSK